MDPTTTDSNSSQEIAIKIASVEFQGEDSLPENVRLELHDKIQQRKIEVAPWDSSEEWVTELNEYAVLETLQSEGYFNALGEVHAYLLKAESQERSYAIAVDVEPGPQYRLKEIHIVNATVFSSDEIRQQFQLSPGDIFSVTKIHQGLGALNRLYGTKGYLNFTAIPETATDQDNRLVDVTFTLDEGQQFRVRSVQFPGLDKETLGLLKSVPEPGQIYDGRVLVNFLDENKSLLPAGASPEDIIVHQDVGQGDSQDKPALRTRTSSEGFSVQHDDETGWLDIVMDFRPCSTR